MTQPLSRTSALAGRHRALGSGLEVWNGMGTAWEYSTDPCDEHDAVREAAGMFDMSPLKKIRVVGPDAFEVVDHLHTRDLAGIASGQSAYGAVLSDEGTVADDAIVFNNDDAGWLVVHGSGETMELLDDSARGHDVSFELDDDLHIVSLQGPKALSLLEAHTSADLSSLKYFHHVDTDLFGHDVMLSLDGQVARADSPASGIRGRGHRARSRGRRRLLRGEGRANTVLRPREEANPRSLRDRQTAVRP